MKKRLYPAIASFVLLMVIIASGITSYYGSGNLENSTTVIIPQGARFSEITEILTENKIIAYPFLFKTIVFLNGESSHIKAGEYAFPAHVSPYETASILASGKTVIHHLTIREGLMTSEILEMVKNNAMLAGEITLDIKEGELYPETYNFSRGDKRNDLLARMRRAMQKTLEEAWAGRAENLPFADSQQALTLASIVEKETGIASERSRVAAVYINRLNKGMLLQADPTTAYAVTNGKAKLSRPLTLKDLTLDSPYNTYKTAGLPPTPIANPGKASILATLHPETSDELYFVATGTGGHNFARTLQEHSENVKKYHEIKNTQH